MVRATSNKNKRTSRPLCPRDRTLLCLHGPREATKDWFDLFEIDKNGSAHLTVEGRFFSLLHFAWTIRNDRPWNQVACWPFAIERCCCWPAAGSLRMALWWWRRMLSLSNPPARRWWRRLFWLPGSCCCCCASSPAPKILCWKEKMLWRIQCTKHNSGCLMFPTHACLHYWSKQPTIHYISQLTKQLCYLHKNCASFLTTKWRPIKQPRRRTGEVTLTQRFNRIRQSFSFNNKPIMV